MGALATQHYAGLHVEQRQRLRYTYFKADANGKRRAPDAFSVKFRCFSSACACTTSGCLPPVPVGRAVISGERLRDHEDIWHAKCKSGKGQTKIFVSLLFYSNCVFDEAITKATILKCHLSKVRRWRWRWMICGVLAVDSARDNNLYLFEISRETAIDN